VLRILRPLAREPDPPLPEAFLSLEKLLPQLRQPLERLVATRLKTAAVRPLVVTRHENERVTDTIEPLPALAEELIAAACAGRLEVADVNHEGKVLVAHPGQQAGEQRFLEARVRRVAERSEREIGGGNATT
jgi:hypothetical protein